MKINQLASLATSAFLALGACDSSKTAEETRTAVTDTVQSPATSSSYSAAVPSHSVPEAPKPVGTCPPDMVKVADRFCIDRYEATMYDTKLGRRASRHYHPSPYSIRNRYKFFKEADEAWEDYQKALDAGISDAGIDADYDLDAGPPTLIEMKVPKPEDWQLNEYFRVKAVSEEGKMPNAFISGILAEDACKNAEKRLCTEEEWTIACRGENDTQFPYGDTYEEGACNIFRLGHVVRKLHGHFHSMSDPRLNLVPINGKILLEKTGNRPKCVSKWGNDGVHDMVGNLDEWIDDKEGTFMGGFYHHQTKKGCEKKETGHYYKYYDYSLGARCCMDLILNQD